MKTTIALLTIALAAVLAIPACTTVTTTAPDGTITKIESPDPATVAAINGTAQAYLASKNQPAVTPEK